MEVKQDSIIKKKYSLTTDEFLTKLGIDTAESFAGLSRDMKTGNLVINTILDVE